MRFRCGKTVTGLVLGGLFVVFPAFATTYSYDVDVQFNFNSKLGVTITDADIKILDLAPGTSADSNIVGITISTNNVAGYTAEATVGNAQNATTNMTHTNGTNTFASIATDASQASLTTDNTWGYAVSTDNGSSWSNFSGLPIYTADGKQLASTNSPASDAIKFKINAKASTSQPAGDYTNVINFKVVANKVPNNWEDVKPDCTTDPTKCDDVTHNPKIQVINEDICEAMETYDTQLQVTDSRDHKNYWISKLRDGNCWMTQNLDLDLDSTKTYTNADTDLGWDGIKYNTASWKPDHSTISASTININGGVPDWVDSNDSPYSLDTGDWYWIGNWMDNGVSTWYRSISSTYGGYIRPDKDMEGKFSRNPYTGNGEHGHVGNHYNWTAAVAMNDSSAYNTWTQNDQSQNPQNSICPSGWRLPIASSTYSYSVGQFGSNDFKNLIYHYNNDSRSDDKAMTAEPLWFVRNGYGHAGTSEDFLHYAGNMGGYWSNSVGGSTYVYYFDIYGDYLSPEHSGGNRYYSMSVRCITRTKNPYTITFNANGGTGDMTSQQINRGSSAKLSANTFTKEGYYFNGWNTKADGKGEGYGDKQLYEVARNNEQAGITLYAQWTTTRTCTKNCDSGNPTYESGITIQRAYELAYTEHHLGMYEETAKGNGIYERVNSWPPDNEPYRGYDVRFAMQDIDLTYNGVKVCDLVTVIGDQYQALDIRDNKLYYISKLADGRCWMTQNLDLDLSVNRTLTPADTDISSNWTPSLSTNDDFIFTSTQEEVNASIYNGVYPGSIDLGNYYWNGTKSTGSLYDKLSDYFDETGNPHYHIGNYYTFAAAVATNDGSTFAENTVVDQSICPADWRIPDATMTSGSLNYMNGIYADYNTGDTPPRYMAPTDNISTHYSNIDPDQMHFSQAQYTLNKTMSNICPSPSICNKARALHPSAGYNVPFDSTSAPSIPRYVATTIRCIAR